MCGLLGLYSTRWSASLRDTFNEGIEKLAHRGPNDKGVELYSSINGSLAMGHTRLSIIDLSDAGHQPMRYDNYAIVFNGEIYNHQELRKELENEGIGFDSETDTEVLLKCWHLWGEACISRLVGMFSFAVYDLTTNKLTLVRDAFGIKPLFYAVEEDRLVFGSEICAIVPLLKNEAKIDIGTAYRYLVNGEYDNSSSTFFQNIRQLEPGHVASYDLGEKLNIEIKKWWTPSIKNTHKLSFEEATIRLRELFLKSVKLHLRSDVPLCVNLSGGIDSSSIACAVRYIYPDMSIDTISFVADNPAFNEEHWIDKVNRHINANAHKIKLKGVDLLAHFDDLIVSQGEPFVSSSVYANYEVFKQARRKGFTVSLEGQGADEMLAGYDGYPNAVTHSLYQKRDFLSIIRFASSWVSWPGRSKIGFLKYLVKNTNNSIILAILFNLSGRTRKPNWLNIGDNWHEMYLKNSNDSIFKEEREIPGRTLMGVLRTALTVKGLPALLRHSDRNSMAWSVESRVPFLTTELVEFCLGLPEEYLVSIKGETKCVFRAAMRGIVPDEILDRKDKIGFSTPEYDWIMANKKSIREWMNYAHKIDCLNGKEFISQIDKVLSGRAPYKPIIWRMINFCRWANLYGLQ